VSTLNGKVAIVTGGGRGIGREEALTLAAEGARVLVNEIASHTEVGATSPAIAVCEEIAACGGDAAPAFGDVADPVVAQNLIRQALDRWGRLDILVNNAGILDDGMVFSKDPEQWFAVVRMHTMGHFLPTRYAAAHWRELAKNGEVSHRSIINTTSESGLFGNAGQTNYNVAKLGIVALTMTTAKELAKYGVTVNAIAPRARTRLTTGAFEDTDRAREFESVADGEFDAMDPANVAPLVAFLAGPHAREITGQTFIAYGGIVAHVRLPHVADTIVGPRRWTVDDLAAQKHKLFEAVGPGVFEGPRGFARLPKQ
jgi:NAD(P)-dependent dehydrogenase (short-subunit alcohol dehydrogenase family)